MSSHLKEYLLKDEQKNTDMKIFYQLCDNRILGHLVNFSRTIVYPYSALLFEKRLNRFSYNSLTYIEILSSLNKNYKYIYNGDNKDFKIATTICSKSDTVKKIDINSYTYNAEIYIIEINVDDINFELLNRFDSYQFKFSIFVPKIINPCFGKFFVILEKLHSKITNTKHWKTLLKIQIEKSLKDQKNNFYLAKQVFNQFNKAQFWLDFKHIIILLYKFVINHNSLCTDWITSTFKDKTFVVFE